MSAYWETLLDKEAVIEMLQRGCMLFDHKDYLSDPMIGYETYVSRQYRMHNNGSCVGYISTEIIDQLLEEGHLRKNGMVYEVIA